MPFEPLTRTQSPLDKRGEIASSRSLFVSKCSDLGQFWAGHHSKHDDDPYRVQHAWLGWYVFDCMKRGASDSTGVVYDVLLSTGLKALVRNLMGTDKQA